MESNVGKQPWFQFGLKTLLIVVTMASVIVACVANWYQLRQRANTAQIERERMYAAYDAGVEDWTAPIEAYRNWCLAENAVPFASRSATCQSYLDYINDFQNRLEGCFSMSLFDDLEIARNRLEQQSVKIEEYRQEAQQWLAAGSASGIPTVNYSISKNRMEQ